LNRVPLASPDVEAAQAWVAAFAEGWRAPASADAFADHFQPWFHPGIRLIQPGVPRLVGERAFRERFAGPLFALIPDLHGQVERAAVGVDCAYIELTLRGTLGGRPVCWRVCDRTTLRNGLVVERESYFDPLPLLPRSSPVPVPGPRSPAPGRDCGATAPQEGPTMTRVPSHGHTSAAQTTTGSGATACIEP
jgi:ketosteroid isomerase-like protein